MNEAKMTRRGVVQTGFLFLFLVFLSGTVHSETFAKKFTDFGSLLGTVRTLDGGYVLVMNDTQNRRVVVSKMNASGARVWQKQIMRKDLEVFEARGVGLSIDGGLFLTLSRSAHAGFFDDEIAVIKLEPHGRIQWKKGFGSKVLTLKTWVARLDSIVGTPDGGALAAGSTCSLACEFLDGFAFVKFDRNGIVEWSKSFRSNDYQRHLFHSVTIVNTSDGGFIVAASSPFETSPSPTLLLKVTSSSKVEWQKSFTKKKQFLGIYVAQDGGLILASAQRKGGKIYLLKLDSNGLEVWKNGIAFNNLSITSAKLALNPSQDGGYVLFGQTSAGSKNKSFLARADTVGSIQNVRVLENRFDNLETAYPNADNSIVLFGSVRDAENSVFVSSLDSSGKLPNCSFSNSPTTTAQGSYGKVNSPAIDLIESIPEMNPLKFSIKFSRLNQKATDFCP